MIPLAVLEEIISASGAAPASQLVARASHRVGMSNCWSTAHAGRAR
jgi:hypothetical protein